MKPVIGITSGDPNGIGYEITVKAATSKEVLEIASPVIIGNQSILIREAKKLGRNGILNKLEIIDMSVDKNELQSFVPGTISCAAGRIALDSIREADRIIKNREIDAIVTAPIVKAAIKLAGSDFHGHTELLAHLTKTKNFGMLFISSVVAVALATIHIPVNEISSNLKTDKLKDLIFLSNLTLQKYLAIKNPEIYCLALNPHKGEHGFIGTEETEIIAPAIYETKKTGLKISGPHSPETVFRVLAEKFRKSGSCPIDDIKSSVPHLVLGMYHDQVLVPLKIIAPYQTVNFTMGLPYIRTSPDHGAAFDIAGKGIANPAGMIEAIKWAVRMNAHSKEI